VVHCLLALPDMPQATRPGGGGCSPAWHTLCTQSQWSFGEGLQEIICHHQSDLLGHTTLGTAVLCDSVRRRGPTAVEHTGLHIADVLLAGKVIQAAAVDSFL
jgi:hypothetical protein